MSNKWYLLTARRSLETTFVTTSLLQMPLGGIQGPLTAEASPISPWSLTVPQPTSLLKPSSSLHCPFKAMFTALSSSGLYPDNLI